MTEVDEFIDEQLYFCVASGKTPPQLRDRINEAIAIKIEMYKDA